jgi:hypothetical protein
MKCGYNGYMSASEIVSHILTGIFVHFTTAADAEAMIAKGIIGMSRTIEDAVYAVAAGGASVEGVQYGGGAGVIGAGGREVAIIFTTDEIPDSIHPEEIIWHRDTDLPFTEAMIVSVDEAIAALDGSLGIPEWPGIFLNPDGTIYDDGSAAAAEADAIDLDDMMAVLRKAA